MNRVRSVSGWRRALDDIRHVWPPQPYPGDVQYPLAAGAGPWAASAYPMARRAQFTLAVMLIFGWRPNIGPLPPKSH
jgi:hypothetical protein